LTEALVEVADVLGCEGSDTRKVVVPEGRHFGIQEGSEVGKEVMREREVVKKRAELRGLSCRSGGFGLCSRR
jgi:hypothetical protein